MILNSKICSRCKKSKHIEEFSLSTRNKDGRLYTCKSCYKKARNKEKEKQCYQENKDRIKKYQEQRKEITAQKTKQRRIEDPDRFTDIRLRSWYGISKAQYDLMHSSQSGKCAICDNVRKLVVDHNHVTGNVRGLLCSKCNSGIGLLEDNISSLRKAIGYLENGK